MLAFRRLRVPHLVKVVSSILLLAGVPFGGYAGYLQLTGNFHTVIAGQLYRSAQPSSAQLERYVRDNGIKTVINLRGNSGNAKWWAEEVAVSDRLGVRHVDFSMSAYKILTPARADELLALMREAPKPILIHCLSGADRTGLVSVLYSQQIAKVKEDTAEKQLSFAFGHVGIPYISSAYAMDESWNDLEKHYGLDERGQGTPVHDAHAETVIDDGSAG